MIIIMKNHATKEQIQNVEDKLNEFGFQTHPIVGEIKTIIGAIGDKRMVTTNYLLTLDGVENVVPIMKPYKLASREFIPTTSIIDVKGVKIGGNMLAVMAGPCAIESEKQLTEVALRVKKSGATLLRGGAFKPRSSPYAFSGLEDEGLKLLAAAGKSADLPIVTEVMDTRDVELVATYADMLQVGARNMQNFKLLKEIGMTKKPVLLKRGLSSTIEEWLMAAEYIMSEGNPNVVLCERGIRTFETSTRNTFDISAVPVTKSLSHLPIIADPSHATGKSQYVLPIAKAAVAAGADGLMIEVHNDPANAMCDGEQSLTPDVFDELMKALQPIASAIGKNI